MKRTPDEIERIFIAGLDVIKRGDATINSYLSQYPDLADELRPQLETSLWLLDRKEAIQPRPGFLPDSKRRLMAKINAFPTGEHLLLG